jgi:hypothetical protein
LTLVPLRRMNVADNTDCWVVGKGGSAPPLPLPTRFRPHGNARHSSPWIARAGHLERPPTSIAGNRQLRHKGCRRAVLASICSSEEGDRELLKVAWPRKRADDKSTATHRSLPRRCTAASTAGGSDWQCTRLVRLRRLRLLRACLRQSVLSQRRALDGWMAMARAMHRRCC